MTDKPESPAPPASDLAAKHLRFGWWALAFFVTLGLLLEALNGFKVGWYLDISSEARRTTLRLAHAHGTLFGLVNVAFALSIARLHDLDERRRKLASACLRAATVLLPGGFLVGGFFVHSGDPGLGVGLVPIGAVLMIVAMVLTARGTPSGR